MGRELSLDNSTVFMLGGGGVSKDLAPFVLLEFTWGIRNNFISSSFLSSKILNLNISCSF